MKMKLFYLLVAMLPLALFSCSSEDSASGDDGIETGNVKATVSFKNGTRMSIGSSAVTITGRAAAPGTRVLGANYGNEACEMYMDDMAMGTMGTAPSIPAGAVDLSNLPKDFKPWEDFGKVDTYVPEGKSYELNAGLNKDIFVKGTLDVTNYWLLGNNARIIVLDGGKVNFNMEALDQITVLCYGSGEFNVSKEKFAINSNSCLMVNGDFKLPGSLQNNGQMFVGGNLSVVSEIKVDNSRLMVNGDIKLPSSLNISNNSQMFVGGNFSVASNIEASNSSLKVNGNFDVPGKMNISGSKMFVGGKFTCNVFDANGNSRVHVIGDATFVNADITNSAMMCVDGTMKSTKLNIDSKGDLCSHGCKIYTDLFTMHNDTKLSAEYIKAGKTELTGCTVVLRNRGLADLGDLTIGSVQNMLFSVENNAGKAMVATTNCFLEEQYSLVTVIGPDFYFNYDHFFVTNQGKEEVQCPGTTNDGFHKVEIGTELVNVGVPGEYKEGECNPGFKPSKEPEEKPEDKPVVIEGEDIILDIPTDIDREWILDADDFAIRVDGAYLEHPDPVNNQLELNGVKITEDNLRITVSGTDKLEKGKEYTYEVWLWVRPESWAAFTDAEKAAWVAGDGEGTDITDKCTIGVPEGFTVRKNVYTGLSGHKDTPYIKVSIHIVKD